jgi:DNA (cytosine-5)-methyltransferase 1
MESQVKFKVGSLYAGVGGICLGFINSGYDISWANEYDKNACITYKENFSHKLIEGDVMEINISSLESIDVLTGGFPCQPFSVAGYRKGIADNRGNHFFRMLDFIDEMRPKVLLFENVKNLVGHDRGNTFQVIKNEIEQRGYTFFSKVLNTKDYGNIPHNRERIFIIGFDKHVYPNSSYLFKFPKKENLVKSVEDVILEEKVDELYYYREDKFIFNILNDSVINSNTIYQFRRHYVRENKSKVCPTLTANMGTGGHNVPLIRTNHGIRKLTPRECFRFQGFPDSFNLPNIANSHLYKQAGNSVSVPVIEKIAQNILKTISGISCTEEDEISFS